MALYACMYFAGLRPAEAVALRQGNCHLPDSDWGLLTLEKSRPEVNRRWTDMRPAPNPRSPRCATYRSTARALPTSLVAITIFPSVNAV
jgi:hypothetical protein